MKLDNYEFTENWVDESHPDIPNYWRDIIGDNDYEDMLEIGTFEGRSTLHFVDAGIREMRCIDVWPDLEVHDRFLRNKKVMEENYSVRFNYYRNHSWNILGEWQKNLVKKFDIIYVDGSHFPHNTILDATLAFRLLRVGGCIIFDDYGWKRTKRGPEYLTPKIGIDAFEKTHERFIEPATVHNYQRAWYKVTEMENYG